MSENKHKQFKAFDKVLVRHHNDSFWNIDFYSHYNNEDKCHETYSSVIRNEDRILPYEGNGHLIGTTNEPSEDIKLEKGEWLFVSDDFSFRPEEWVLRKFDKCKNSIIPAFSMFNTSLGKLSDWMYAIRFADFNPNDMEETLKHILCIKDGKLVRYKE